MRQGSRSALVVGIVNVGLAAAIAACGAPSTASLDSSSDEQALTSEAPACAEHAALLRAALAPESDSEDQNESVQRGRHAYNDRVLHGLGANGRACADCHMANDQFQLSPASAKARYDALQACRAVNPKADDPLFRPLDADDFRTKGDQASDFTNLTENGLIRVTMPLPANVKLVDPASCKTNGQSAPCQTAAEYRVSDETFVDVWRSVPSSFNVSVSGPDGHQPAWPRDPNRSGGYQLDGRVDTLQNQALGALLGHAEAQATPPVSMLDDIAAFQNQLNLPGEPALNELETQGKAVFERACATCHSGPGLSTPSHNPQLVAQVQHYHDIQTACPRVVDTVSPPRWSFAACPPRLARNARTYEITFADGFKRRRTGDDPGRLLLTGFSFSANPPPPGQTCAHVPCGPPILDDWQKLDSPPLHGISKRAPYFHNNSAATLLDVVKHYEELFKFAVATTPPGSPLPLVVTTDGVHIDRPNQPEERDALVAYLNRL